MIVTTTPSIEGYQIADDKGIVVGAAIMGGNSMLMVSASGTAVVIG
nr:heavy metal-binding domain-containing protein [Pseudophaeobacter leonis]